MRLKVILGNTIQPINKHWKANEIHNCDNFRCDIIRRGVTE